MGSLCISLINIEIHNKKLFLNKARAVLLSAESAREFSADQLKHNVFKTDLKELKDVLYTVPIFTAMEVARNKAKELGYTLKVPKVSPRNPDNQPDEAELRILSLLDDKSKKEHWEIDEKTNQIRIFRPVVLTEECLNCHGDPANSQKLWGRADGKDITGVQMEGWKVGEVHGAFELKMDLKPVDEAVAAQSLQIAGIASGFTILIVLIGLVISSNINKGISKVQNDLVDLTTDVINGKLDTRANVEETSIDFREVVKSTNGLIEAFVKPINVTSDYIERISNGEIPAKITDEYKGDFNVIKNNVNHLIGTLDDFIKQMENMSTQHDLGQIDVIMNADSFNGSYRAMAVGVNDMVNGHIAVKKQALGIVEEYGNGNFAATMPPLPGQKVFINHTLDKVKDNLNRFIDEMNYMSQQHDIGEIDVFIRDERFTNAWQDMARGVNGMVQGHIAVKKQAMAIVEEYGNGNFNAVMPPLPGKKVFINNILNKVQGNLLNLSSEVEKLIDGAKDGQLDIRGNDKAFQGDWQKIVYGLNEVLEAIATPLNEANHVLGIMSNGDLTVSMEGNYRGELDNLKHSINTLGSSLQNLIGQVAESVKMTSVTAFEMTATAETLAAASQEQSAQSDEVASAVEEMSRTVSDNAQSAGRTAEVAERNGAVARDGGDVVEQTIGKMKDIAAVVSNSASNIQKLGESSKEIGEIISVIDDIADQTNLLALNAAIEAARAGEQGRGFAVVADEVRKLAERTTEATKQIATMIKGIQADTETAVLAMNKGNEEVQNGINLADRAGESLREIVQSSQDVLDMINVIVVASEEQAATSEQISKNVVSISQVTAESALQIEEIAKNSEQLSNMTEQLNQLVGQFKIEESPSSRAATDHYRNGNGAIQKRRNGVHLNA